MGLQRIEIDKTFPFPVDALFHHLSEHENLSALFAPAKVRRVKAGDVEPNGVGSVRRLSLPLTPPFEETVTEFEPDRRIAYRITKGSPLRDHFGKWCFPGTVTVVPGFSTPSCFAARCRCSGHW